MVFLLKNDAEKFWHRVTGKRCHTDHTLSIIDVYSPSLPYLKPHFAFSFFRVSKVPVDTAKSYVRSLLFIDHEDDHKEDGDIGSEEEGEKKLKSSAGRLLTRGISRIEEACGGFAPHHSPTTSDEETLDNHMTSSHHHTSQHSGVRQKRKLRNCVRTNNRVEEIPNLIQGWGDNKFLSRIVRTTPLVVNAY